MDILDQHLFSVFGTLKIVDFSLIYLGTNEYQGGIIFSKMEKKNNHL